MLQHDHRPTRPDQVSLAISCIALNLLDPINDAIKGGRHDLMYLFRFMALDEIGRVAVAAQKLLQMFVGNTC